MIEQDRDGEKVLPIGARQDNDDDLGYEVVLASAGDHGRERLLAKAASGQLAQAIFNAARSEHPGQRIILRRDMRVIIDSANEKAR